MILEQTGLLDMIFLERQLKKKYIEQQVPLYQVFIELTKTLDTANHDALWKILGKVGCSPTFFNLLRQVHKDIKAHFTLNDSLSEEISVNNGTKQDDILVLTLSLSVYFAVGTYLPGL